LEEESIIFLQIFVECFYELVFHFLISMAMHIYFNQCCVLFFPLYLRIFVFFLGFFIWSLIFRVSFSLFFWFFVFALVFKGTILILKRTKYKLWWDGGFNRLITQQWASWKEKVFIIISIWYLNLRMAWWSCYAFWIIYFFMEHRWRFIGHINLCGTHKCGGILLLQNTYAELSGTQICAEHTCGGISLLCVSVEFLHSLYQTRYPFSC